MADKPDVTALLKNWRSDDERGQDALMSLIYDELHRRAENLFRNENPGQTIQPTALVHEAYENLVGVEVSWSDRTHFYALATRMMKRLLINRANARRAAKRGGGELRVTLDERVAAADDVDANLLDLADALEALAAMDPRKAELIELQYFGGLTLDQMHQVTGLSTATITRDLRFARAWLKGELSESSE